MGLSAIETALYILLGMVVFAKAFGYFYLRYLRKKAGKKQTDVVPLSDGD